MLLVGKREPNCTIHKFTAFNSFIHTYIDSIYSVFHNFEKSNIFICIDQMNIAALHFKAMIYTFFLSRAFFNRKHHIGAMP